MICIDHNMCYLNLFIIIHPPDNYKDRYNYTDYKTINRWTRQLLHSNIITIESDVVLTLTADDYMLIIGL